MGQQPHVIKYDPEGRYDYNCGGMGFFSGPPPGPTTCCMCGQPLVRETLLESAVAAAKRELAEKVLAVVNDRTKPCADWIEVTSLRIGLEQLFTESGVAVEQEG